MYLYLIVSYTKIRRGKSPICSRSGKVGQEASVKKIDMFLFMDSLWASLFS